MVIVVATLWLGSATDVAVMVTMASLGTAAGAVKVVLLPLDVDVGEMLPHYALPQFTDHLAPAWVLSPFTTAAICVVAPATMAEGGLPLKATLIDGPMDPPPPPPHPARTNTDAAVSGRILPSMPEAN